MKKLIKLLISIITTRERLLRSNAKLQTKIEMLEWEINQLNETMGLIDRVRIQDNLKVNKYTQDMSVTLGIIKEWINKHEGSQWKN